MKNRIRILMLVLFAFSLIIVSCTDDDDGVSNPETSTVKIGALLPLTGELEEQGLEVQTLLELAVVDANIKLEENNSNIRLELEISDTEAVPNLARTHMEVMAQSGINCFIGPISSAEMIELGNSSMINNCLVFSPSSTSTELSIEDDSFYRFVPGDARMANALVDVMWEQGIRYLATMYRDDSWGRSLAELIPSGFENSGGQVISSVMYHSLRESSARIELINIATTIQGLNVTIDQVAIQVSSFNEAVMLFKVAYELLDEYPVLGDVRWYGSDGFVQNETLFDSPQYSQFATNVNFISPIMGIPESDDYTAFLVQLQGNEAPWSYAVIAYDIIQIAGEMFNRSTDTSDVQSLKAALLSATDNYSGLSGNISLDENGDRAGGLYHFWQVNGTDGVYTWDHVLTYEDGQIITP